MLQNEVQESTVGPKSTTLHNYKRTQIMNEIEGDIWADVMLKDWLYTRCLHVTFSN